MGAKQNGGSWQNRAETCLSGSVLELRIADIRAKSGRSSGATKNEAERGDMAIHFASK